MANINIKNFDVGGIIIGDPEYSDETIKFTGADTFVAGLVMARDTSDDKVVPYVSGGPNGTGIPSFILTVELINAGAGDLPDRPLMSGKVRLEKLVIKAGGGIPNKEVQDQLRDFTIISKDVDELNTLDNQ